MNYRQTIDYLFTQLPMYQRVGGAAFKKDLSNIIKLCTGLSQPQLQFPSIHIAGTNGKGSSAHMLSAILQSSGLKTGIYTSPHYKDFRERIKIDGQYISEEAVIKFVKINQSLFEAVRPSFFEITVAMAFSYFAEQKVDIAIIETGLGGRLDSTNIITPLLSLITNISYDHQQFLGDTLELIATEKAGIIKAETPVVISEYQEEIIHVFKQKATSLNAPLFIASLEYDVQLISSAFTAQQFNIYRKEELIYKDLALSLIGDFQQKNLIGILMVIKVLCKMGYSISEKAVRDGLTNVQTLTNIIGRWQILSKSPTVLCDSGHNEGGLKVIIPQLLSMDYNKLHIVYGMVNDKSPEKIASILPGDAQYYFAKADIPRGMEAKKLCRLMNKAGLEGNSYSSVQNALQAALQVAQEDDFIFVGGSIFVVAEVLEFWKFLE